VWRCFKYVKTCPTCVSVCVHREHDSRFTKEKSTPTSSEPSPPAPLTSIKPYHTYIVITIIHHLFARKPSPTHRGRVLGLLHLPLAHRNNRTTTRNAITHQIAVQATARHHRCFWKRAVNHSACPDHPSKVLGVAGLLLPCHMSIVHVEHL
jgi:hypothetical protein